MADFEAMEKGEKPAAPAKPTAKKKSEKDAEPAAGDPAVKPPEKEPEIETPPEVKPVRAKELREAHDNLKKRVNSEYLPKIQQLEAKLKELEGKPGEEAKPLQDKISVLEKRNAELEQHMAFVDYTQTGEFKKIEKEYSDAWDRAVGTFKQLSIEDPDSGERRPATEEDLLSLANLSLDQMDQRANELFGHSAARVITHIEKLKELSQRQHDATEAAKKNASEWRKNNQELALKSNQSRLALWGEINKSLEEKFPKAYKPEEGNAEDLAAHTKGFALANLKYLGEKSLTPEQVETLPAGFKETVKSGKQLTPAQHVQLDAMIRLRAANHDRRVADLKKANARIEELEQALAEYEDSEPKAKTPKSGPAETGKSPEEQVAEEIAALDK